MRTISRRLMLGGLGAAPLLRATAGAQDKPAPKLPFHVTGVEHVGTVVPDVRTATQFHSKLFNPAIMTEMNPTPLRCYVDLKPGYLAFGSRPNEPRAFFDHYCALIYDYDQAAVAETLGEAGLPQNNPAFTLFPDPDGVGVQLYGDPGGWFPTVVPMEPMVGGPSIVRPHGIEYVMLNVADVGASVAFYRKIFGPTDLADGPWTWLVFDDNYVGLRQVPEGGTPSIDHIRVRVDPFDEADVMDQLARLGAVDIRKTFHPENVSGVVSFTDPQGLRIELMEF
jgi:catechol 2,3-dioxygenase-like lactoylglutathione lyase family enzyme